MKKTTISLLTATFITLSLAACSQETIENDGKIPRGIPQLKQVEIFQVSKDQPTLTFSKSGTVKSSSTAYITPQIAGKITKINVKTGQKVKKGDTLITLGDSFSTDSIDLQYKNAQKSLELAQNTQKLTHQTGEGTYFNAKVGTELALESYKNAIQARQDAEDLFEKQQESAELSIDTAEEAYETAKENYNDLTDSLDELEDQYDELKNSQDADAKTLAELSKSISQLESQISNAEFAKESAQNAADQADLGMEQAEDNFDAQMEQMDFAIKAAYLQYQTALIQAKNAQTGSQLQELSVAQQILQIAGGLDAAALTVDQKNLKSPIDGTVTEVSAKENNLVSPGQILMKIENSDSISIKTSVNKEEAKFLNASTKVTIETDSVQIQGHIVSISPTLNELTGKIELEVAPNEVGQSQITPGSFVKIHFSTQAKDKIFIPLNSISLDEDKKLIRVLDGNNFAQITQVTLGQIMGDYVEITSGLNGNETIISDVSPIVQEGERVIPLTE